MACIDSCWESPHLGTDLPNRVRAVQDQDSFLLATQQPVTLEAELRVRVSAALFLAMLAGARATFSLMLRLQLSLGTHLRHMLAM